MKISFPILFLIFILNQSISQFHLGIGINYPFSLSPKTLIYDQTTLNDSIIFVSSTTKDNFTKVSIPIFAEINLKKNVSLKLEYKYLTNNYSVIYSRDSFGYRELSELFNLHNLTLQILTYKSLSTSSTLSFGFGITTLFAGNYTNASKVFTSFSADVFEIKYFNGVNIGIKSSVSYGRNLFKRISLFTSVDFELASWRPKEYEITKFVIRGVDQLPTLPGNSIRGKLMDECNLKNTNNDEGCRLPEFINFEYLSLSIGIKYRIL